MYPSMLIDSEGAHKAMYVLMVSGIKLEEVNDYSASKRLGYNAIGHVHLPL